MIPNDKNIEIQYAIEAEKMKIKLYNELLKLLFGASKEDPSKKLEK